MKHTLKSVLAFVLSLAILLVPVTASAASGTYNDKHILSTSSKLTVDIPAETTVYVQATNSNGSTVDASSNVSLAGVIQYCTQIVPATGTTASFAMIVERDWFTMYNSSSQTMRVELTLTAGVAQDTTGTVNNPELITLEDPYQIGVLNAYVTKALEANNQGYYYKVLAPGDGVINVSANAYDNDYNDMGWIYFANNVTQGKYGDNHWSDDEEVVYNEQVPVKAGDEVIVFAATYNPMSAFVAPAGNIGVSVSFSEVGSYDCPVEATLGKNVASIKNGNGYYFFWTATADGTATVTMNTATDWEYRVNGIPVDPEDYANYYYGDSHWSDDETIVTSESVELKKGEKLEVFVNTYNPSGATSSGNIEWTLSFDAGEVGDDNQGGESEDPEEEEVNYTYGATLEVGANTQDVDVSQPYVVFDFSPAETGKYTFTVAEGLIGVVSFTDMWVQNLPSEDNVNATSVVWDCTSVGQGIYIAVKHESESVSVTIDREELVVEETVPWIYYENTVKPAAFVFTGNFDDLDYVDTFDSVNDKAVLGTDGYYHLNSATGPILYVCLNDPLMNLADAVQYGQLKEVIANSEGKVLERTDFNEAFNEYFACADTETGLYPLTADLIEMYQRIGAYQMWYGETGFIGGDLEDAWMFACYYKEGANTVMDGNATTKPTGTNGTSPNTADVSDAMSVLLVAILAAGVIALTSKKAKA